MSLRELTVLGTASQVPTRTRNHNGYLLRWDGEAVLFDPGEGTQRQLAFAGLPASAITRICITHLHGDHCLGLPGVLQRMALDGARHPVHLYFPASGTEQVDHLLRCAVVHDVVDLVLHPVREDGVADVIGGVELQARRLDHRTETYGWRWQEPPGRRMLPDRLAAAGISGPQVGELVRDGSTTVGGRVVTVDDMSEPKRGQSFAFVMDTRECEGAEALADRADLLVCEATFLHRDAVLAERYAHLTAVQAARLGARAAARRLVLTHFSQRYDDPADYLAEAAPVVPDVVVAADLDVVPVPLRERHP